MSCDSPAQPARASKDSKRQAASDTRTMAEGSLASAVALPDPETTAPQPHQLERAQLRKRRASSATIDSGSESTSSTVDGQQRHRRQRPRVADSPDRGDGRDALRREGQTATAAAATAAGARTSRTQTSQDEERRRGRRLYGALLGTLSQQQGPQESAAQKRRMAIERKLQDKLRLQDEAYGELRRQRRDELMARRRREQRLYDVEAMRTRHANLLATARFLKTKTQPPLFYLPWRLRPGEEDIIREQVQDAEATAAREAAQVAEREDAEQEDAEVPPAARQPAQNVAETPAAAAAAATAATGAGADADEPAAPGDSQPGTNADEGGGMPATAAGTQAEAVYVRAADDDGGEVMEGAEDTVIY